MSRQKKNGKFLNCYVKQEIMDQLDEFSKKSLIPKTSIVEEALKQYFDKNKLKNLDASKSSDNI